MAAVVQLGNALLTDLTDTLTGKPHLCTNLLQTALLATYATFSRSEVSDS